MTLTISIVESCCCSQEHSLMMHIAGQLFGDRNKSHASHLPSVLTYLEGGRTKSGVGCVQKESFN